MKVVVFGESEADETALRILLQGVLGAPAERHSGPPFRGRAGGWNNVIVTLPAVIKHVHYQTDAEALVVVLDSDDSPVHREVPGNSLADCAVKCRLCRLRAIVNGVKSQLRPVSGKGILKTALGLAVPQIEAWYLAGEDPQVHELAWKNGQESGVFTFSRKTLKADVYGTDRPPLELEIGRARQAAERIVSTGKLPRLEQLFPDGFRPFADEIRRWRANPPGN